MKKIVVMLLVLGLVATPVFAKNKKKQYRRNSRATVIQPLKLYGEVEQKKFQAVYQAYAKLLSPRKKGQKAPSKAQKAQALSQVAAAYLQIPVIIRGDVGWSYFSGIWVLNDKGETIDAVYDYVDGKFLLVKGQEVDVLDFLAEQKGLFAGEQLATYEEFLQVVKQDIEAYKMIHFYRHRHNDGSILMDVNK